MGKAPWLLAVRRDLAQNSKFLIPQWRARPARSESASTAASHTSQRDREGIQGTQQDTTVSGAGHGADHARNHLRRDTHHLVESTAGGGG